jgi:hypothetical protein
MIPNTSAIFTQISRGQVVICFDLAWNYQFVNLWGSQPLFATRLGRKSLEFSQGSGSTRGGLAQCMAKPMVGSPIGGLTHHGAW